jgi:glutamate 5-kinase
VSIYRREYCPAIGDKSAQGRGGMQAKIDAALAAVKGGVPSVVIASGHEPGVIGKVAAGVTKGTLFARAVLFPEGALCV